MNFRKLFRKREHEKLLLLFVAIIILLMLQVLFLFLVSGIYKNIYFNNISKAELSEGMTNFEAIITDVQQVAVRMQTDTDVMNMLYSDLDTAQKEKQFVILLKRIKSFCVHLNNISVYRQSTDSFYTADGAIIRAQNLEDGATKEFMQNKSLKQEKYHMILDSARSRTGSDNEVLRVCNRISQRTDDILLIDIDFYKIDSAFRQYRNNYGGQIAIIDKNNSIVYNSGDGGLADALLEDRENLKELEFSESAVIRRYNGRKYLIQAASSEFFGNIYGTIPVENIKLENIWLKEYTLLNVALLIVLAVIVSIVWGILLLKKTLHSYKEQQQKAHFLKSRDDIINCLLDESVNKECKQNAEKYIKSLPAGGENKECEIFALLRIDLYNFQTVKKKWQMGEISLFKYGMINMVEEISQACCPAHAIFEKDGFIVFLLIDPGEDYEGKCQLLFERLCGAMKEYIGEKICAFVSEVGVLSQLHALYTQTEELAQYRYVMKQPQILFSSFVSGRKMIDSEKVSAMCGDLCREIFLNKQAAETELTRFFETLSSLCIYDIKLNLWNLLLCLVKYIEPVYLKKGMVFHLNQFIAELNAQPNLWRAKEFFNSFIDSGLKLMEGQENQGKEHTLVNRVAEEINRGFRNQEVNSDYIASKIGLSKVYLSRMYHQETGKSISDSLNDRRLSEAAELLAKTDCSIAEIVENTGFTNRSYFTVIFKKRFNETPAAYRKREKMKSF